MGHFQAFVNVETTNMQASHPSYRYSIKPTSSIPYWRTISNGPCLQRSRRCDPATAGLSPLWLLPPSSRSLQSVCSHPESMECGIVVWEFAVLFVLGSRHTGQSCSTNLKRNSPIMDCRFLYTFSLVAPPLMV